MASKLSGCSRRAQPEEVTLGETDELHPVRAHDILTNAI